MTRVATFGKLLAEDLVSVWESSYDQSITALKNLAETLDGAGINRSSTAAKSGLSIVDAIVRTWQGLHKNYLDKEGTNSQSALVMNLNFVVNTLVSKNGGTLRFWNELKAKAH